MGGVSDPMRLHPSQVAEFARHFEMVEGRDYTVAEQIKDPVPKFALQIGKPPCYEAALERFPVIKHKPLIFAYAPYIYCVNRARCGPEKVAHETVHLIRQGSDPAAWWARYLSDDAFRSEEEVLAHVAEYLFLCEKESGRGARRRNLVTVAANLASPIYGRMFTVEEAKQLLKSCAKEAAEHVDGG